MPILVALYDQWDEAQNAARDLASHDFLQPNLFIIPKNPGGQELSVMELEQQLHIPSADAEIYVEGVRRGGTLLAVYTEEPRTSKAVEILNTYRPVDLLRRVQAWRQEGWQTGRAGAESYENRPASAQQEPSDFAQDLDRAAPTASSPAHSLADLLVSQPGVPFQEWTAIYHAQSEQPVVRTNRRVYEEAQVKKNTQEEQAMVKDTVRRQKIEIDPN